MNPEMLAQVVSIDFRPVDSIESVSQIDLGEQYPLCRKGDQLANG
jgi:hypothetical protein